MRRVYPGPPGPQGPPGPGAGSDPWTTVQWVNGDTVVATENGSIGEPWSTVTEGVAGLGGPGVLNIAPLDYTAEPTVTIGNDTSFQGAGPVTPIFPSAKLPDIDTSATPLSVYYQFVDVTHVGSAAGSITGLSSIIRCTDPTLTADIFARLCSLETAGAGLIRAIGSSLEACTASDIGAVDCTVFGALVGSTRATCEGCYLSSTVNGGTLIFENCAGFLGDVTGTVSARFTTCYDFGAITIDAPIIEMDATSYAAAVSAGVTFATAVTLIDGSDGILNQSSVAGTTVSDALDALSGNSAMASANAETNTYATGTVNYQAATGNAFAADVTGADWSFNATACVWTYTGALTRMFLVIIDQTLSTSAIGTMGSAVSKNGDGIGTSGGTLQTQGASRAAPAATGTAGQLNVTSVRVVSLATNDTIQPIGANSNSGATTTIRRLTVTIVPLPG